MVDLLILYNYLYKYFFCFSFSSVEAFTQEHSSNRLPYSSLPIILQRFGIILSENDLILAAKDLGYNCKI